MKMWGDHNSVSLNIRSSNNKLCIINARISVDIYLGSLERLITHCCKQVHLVCKPIHISRKTKNKNKNTIYIYICLHRKTQPICTQFASLERSEILRNLGYSEIWVILC